MADVFITATYVDLADQIAGLLNQFNRLTKIHDRHSILLSKDTYFVEIVRDKVVGCIAVKRLDESTDKIKHLCVHPDYRDQGIGKKLINTAINHSKNRADYSIMDIRSDNIISFTLASLLGFVHINTRTVENRTILTLRRKIR